MSPSLQRSWATFIAIRGAQQARFRKSGSGAAFVITSQENEGGRNRVAVDCVLTRER